MDRACSAPAMPHGMNTNTQGTCDPSGDNGFGMQGGVQGQQSMEGGVFDVNTRPDMDGYPGLERSSVSRAQSPIDHDSPGVGAATVARRLLTGSKGGVPHVRSEPVLSSRLGEGAGEPMKPQSGGWSPESAGGHDAGKAKKVVEQAPKSEPKNKATDKDEKRRRVSASGAAAAAAAAVTAKPGRFTKMMAKLFYPDAKVLFVIVSLGNGCVGYRAAVHEVSAAFLSFSTRIHATLNMVLDCCALPGSNSAAFLASHEIAGIIDIIFFITSGTLPLHRLRLVGLPLPRTLHLLPTAC